MGEPWERKIGGPIARRKGLGGGPAARKKKEFTNIEV